MNRTITLRALGFIAVITGALAPSLGLSAAEGGQDLAEALALDPPEFDVDDLNIRLGGMIAGGSLFTASQQGGPAFPGGYDVTRTTGQARLYVNAQRTFDNGMVLGARSDFLLYHDELSGDNYDQDTIERLYVFAQTGFGRVEIGEQDGAAYNLGLTGPVADDLVSLENRDISLFRNPSTGRDFAQFFEPVTAVQSTSNYSKINYVSPRLFGIQIGASFTPQTVRTPLPWTGNPRNDFDQQQNIWEVAASYTGYFSDVALGLSAGYARGSLKNSTSAGADLYDWALGAQLAYTISDVKLSLGSSYRDTNAYLLDVRQVLDGSKVHGVHLSATAERGSWILGAEYSNSDISGPVDYEVTGYEAVIGYRLNENLTLTGGWQWYNYGRNSGTFYNGRPAIDMNAGFLAFSYEL